MRTNTVFNALSFCYLLILVALLANLNEFNYHGVIAQITTCFIYLLLLRIRNKYTWFLLLVYIGVNFVSYYFYDDRLTEYKLIYLLFVQVFPFHYFNTIGMLGYKHLTLCIYCLVLVGLFGGLLTKKGRRYYNFKKI